MIKKPISDENQKPITPADGDERNQKSDDQEKDNDVAGDADAEV